MEAPILKAEKRKLLGRKVKKLRQMGILPANIYGKKIKSLSIEIKEKDFEDIFKKVGETGIIQIMLGKEKRPALVHNLQTDPIKDKNIHVDFLQVDLKQKVTAEVPIELVGESPAEKQELGTMVQYIDEIEVEALPTNLPDKFELDTSSLKEVDQALHVKDLKYDKSKLDIKADLESIIVKIEEVKEEAEEVSPAPVETKEGAAEVEAKEEPNKQEEGESTDEKQPDKSKK